MQRLNRTRHCGDRSRPTWGGAAAAVIFTTVLATAGCSDQDNDASPDQVADSAGRTGSGGDQDSDASTPLTPELNDAGPPVAVVAATAPGAASVAVSRQLFRTSPVVVVAQAGDPAAVQDGADRAAGLGVPLLLIDPAPGPAQDSATATSEDTSGTASPGDDASSVTAPTVEAMAQRAEISRLGAESVLALGSGTRTALGDLPQARVVTEPGDLPQVSPAAGSDLTVLVRASSDPAVRGAATASAQAVGAQVIEVATDDLRADPAAIEALAGQTPGRVLAVGPGFAPVQRLSGRLEVAATGTQLPGGGQVIFPGRRLVALYGHPGTAGLGVLGEQGIQESIIRAQEIAADYEPFSPEPVVPAFEIIATVASSSAGGDGDYSAEASVEQLRPWVERAGEEGVYVVLDLQPGRADFLDQAKVYEDLLRMPHVGLALDPEWRLTETQVPLGQIGQVEADEVNSVIDWLADLTTQDKLPQKLLVLHQFRLSMLQDEGEIELGRDQVQVLIHMDGQGAPHLKDETWRSVVGAAPEGVPFGWKNFYDEDVPMLTPQETMAKEPTPLMISYQ